MGLTPSNETLRVLKVAPGVGVVSPSRADSRFLELARLTIALPAEEILV
jgi:hypothetical protein